MIRRVRPRASRRGLSLLEVVIALAIFLFSLTALSQLVSFATDRAQDTSDRSVAARLCQSKLGEVLGGAVPLTAQSETAFDESPEFVWSMTADSGPVTNLFLVAVTVSRTRQDGSRIECTLTQMVLDPSVAGSTQDVPQATTSSTSTSSTKTGN